MKPLLANSNLSAKDARGAAAIPPETRIVLLFLALSAIWILVSDRLVALVAGDDFARGTVVQTIKGLFFITAVATWLYFVLRRSFQKRERAVAMAAKTSERFELVARASNDAIWDWNLMTNRIWWSQGFQSLFGYERQDLEPTIEWWTRLLHPDDRERAVAGIHQIINAGGKTWSDEYRFCCKDGSYVYVYDKGFVVHDASGKPIRMVGGMMDVTARKRAEQQVELSRRQMRALSARQDSMREAERTRIAREIHDQLGQMLTGLKMNLKWIEKRLNESDTERSWELIKDRLADAAQLADQTIECVQNISAEIRPSVLDHLGLATALKFEAERFNKRVGIDVTLHSVEAPPGLKKEVAGAMFRIFQEALTNVARHANASAVDIRLSQTEGDLVLTIKDNGKGISAEALANPRSLGLLGMKERASLLGGEVRFESPPEGGTVVTLRVPKTANDTKFWELI